MRYVKRNYLPIVLRNNVAQSRAVYIVTSWTLSNELPLPGNPGNNLIRPAAMGRPGWRIRHGFVEDCDGPVRFPSNPIPCGQNTQPSGK